MLTQSVQSITRPKDIEISPAEVLDALAHKAGPLPQLKLEYEAAVKTLWVTIAPEPKPVFTFDLVDSVARLQKAIVDLWGPDRHVRSPIHYFAYRASGQIFTMGGDLDFYLDCIAKGDRSTLREYARLSIEGVLGNASSISGSAITMATIEGKGIGGGIDAPLSCNMVIAEEQASFTYPEVKFNHFPITAVAVLSRRIGARAAHKLLATAAELSASEFAAIGALDAVVSTGQGEAWLRKYATETMPMHGARLGLFSAFHRRRAEEFKAELQAMAEAWSDYMLRLTPMEISRLQRISTGQERMLQHLYAEKARAKAPPESVDVK
ncbi:MAG: crotonase/enoyl-CoA hydratase family protein [Methylovirgula sp.]